MQTAYGAITEGHYVGLGPMRWCLDSEGSPLGWITPYIQFSCRMESMELSMQVVCFWPETHPIKAEWGGLVGAELLA